MYSMRYVQAATRPPGRTEKRGIPRPAHQITSEVRRIERRRYRK
ncbi:hypothetical protein HNR15_000817 [Allobranchiibius huperziae]|uniref:Uncharacterized protein n=1 Tax=Allobranchiibius huperziae TaxID=1874116 RepID=A0A853DFL9_9MICO|nr:hypothetical protein [Allobranchiibius huperziae]